MRREASSKRPPHPARLCLTAPAGPTSPAEGRGEGKALGKAFADGFWPLPITIEIGKSGRNGRFPVSLNMGRWGVFGLDAVDPIRGLEMAIGRIVMRAIIAEQRQRPGEIGEQRSGKTVRAGRRPMASESPAPGALRAPTPPTGGGVKKARAPEIEQASRHVAKVATARTNHK